MFETSASWIPPHSNNFSQIGYFLGSIFRFFLVSFDIFVFGLSLVIECHFISSCLMPIPCSSKPTNAFLGQILTALGLKSVKFPVHKTCAILCPLCKVIWMMSGSEMLILFSRSVDLLHQKLQYVSDTLALQEYWFWPQISTKFVAFLQYLWAKPFNRITNNLLWNWSAHCLLYNPL